MAKNKSEHKKLEIVNLELDEVQNNEIEKEKFIINEELDRNKKYLIEEVLEDGEFLLKEIEKKEKKSFWNKFMDFIFK